MAGQWMTSWRMGLLIAAAGLVPGLCLAATGEPSKSASPAGAKPAAVQAHPAIRSDADARTVVILVRGTLVALAQANETGNYGVLNDLAAPRLRQKVTSADLAQAFAPLRAARVNLMQTIVLDPKFDAAPSIDANGLLHASGQFATPHPVKFDLVFEPVDGVWRYIRLVVTPAVPASPAADKKPGA